MRRQIASLVGRLRGDESGAVVVLVAIAIAVLLGAAALAVDVGNVAFAQRRLQATADMAALAGASQLYCTGCANGTAIATASSYSAVSGGKNAQPGLTVTMGSGYPQLVCLTTLINAGIPCTGANAPNPNANAIVVQQKATVLLTFARVFDKTSVQLTATAKAAKGGSPPPLNVMIVVDTTLSMNDPDTNGNSATCGTSNPTRIQCAMFGLRTILGELSPLAANGGAWDQVGLMVFPPLNANTARGGGGAPVSYDYDCSASTVPVVEAYNAPSPTYQVVGLSDDYRTSNTAKSLNASSNLVTAAHGVANCAGLTVIGGEGTYFAAAITAAQSALAAAASPNLQNVIILLSDGEAGNGYGAPSSNQCNLAITAAHNAAKAGTWVYAVAYGTSKTAGSCQDRESPAVTACQTMQQIASSPTTIPDPSRFYSDGSGGSGTCVSQNPYADLGSIFQQIGNSFGVAHLLPNNTT